MWFKKKENKSMPVASCEEVEFISVFCVTLMRGKSVAISIINEMGQDKRNSMVEFVNRNIEKTKSTGALSPIEVAGYDLIMLLSVRAFVDDQSSIHIMKILMINGFNDKIKEAMDIANDMSL